MSSTEKLENDRVSLNIGLTPLALLDGQTRRLSLDPRSKVLEQRRQLAAEPVADHALPEAKEPGQLELELEVEVGPARVGRGEVALGHRAGRSRDRAQPKAARPLEGRDLRLSFDRPGRSAHEDPDA